MLRNIGLLFTAVFTAIFISACSVATPTPPVGVYVSPVGNQVAVDAVLRVTFDKPVDVRGTHVRLLEVPDNAPVIEVPFDFVVETPGLAFAIDPRDDLSFGTDYALEVSYTLNGERVGPSRFDFTTVSRQTASIIISETEFVYNAREREVSVRTVPVGLPYQVNYYLGTELLDEAPVDVGTYDVVVTVTSREYVGEARAVLNISPLQINVTGYRAADKVYDGTDSVVVSGTPVLVGALDRDVYIRTARFWFSDVNAGENVAVRSAFVLDGSRSDNYLVLSPNIIADITPAPAVVVPRLNQYRVYGEQDPVLMYDVTGLVSQSDRVTGLLARAEGENVGFYQYTLGTLTAGDNYTLSVAETTTRFEVVRRQVVVTPLSGQTAEYLDADPILRYTVNGLVFDDELAGALSRETGTAIGDYLITLGTLRVVDGEGNFSNNYTLTLTPETYFSITMRHVVVTPDAGQFKRVGEVDPVFSWTITPAPRAEDWALITGQLARVPGETECTTDCYDYLIGTLTFPSYYEVEFDTAGRQFLIIPAR